MAKVQRKWKSIVKRSVAGILSVVVVSGNYQLVQAENTDSASVENMRTEIISQVGNAEMKALGEAVENGMEPQVKQAAVPEGKGITYYVDSEKGNDENSGTSEDEPWKSIEKVNAAEYHAGDRILFKAGSVWEGQTLQPKGSGEAGSPIIISSYGDGNMPEIAGNGEVGEAVLLMNQEYWDISNLNISNTVEELADLEHIKVTDENGSSLDDLRGIRIAGKDAGQLDGYDLHDLYVHDVTGEDCWISGTGEVGPGITKGTGWDKSKRTGGIVFEICQPETSEPTTFNDITIENNIINNNSFGGIVVKQWKGDKAGTNELWASREEGKKNAPTYECDNWNPHTNVTIQDNYLSQQNSDYACNTIYLTSTQDAVIQRNISREAGTCGIELYYTDNTVVQYNEVFDTRVKAGGADSNAIDPDKAATNALIQYNYIHDTGDGILLCGFVFGSAVVRYNVIQDAEKRYLNPHGDQGVNYVYNNIFYNTKEKSHVPFVESSGGTAYLEKTKNMHYLYNNIFYNTAESTKTVGIGEGAGMQYDSNCYYGTAVNAAAQDENAVTLEPQFVNSDLTEAKEDISKLAYLQVQATSPVIGAGKQIEQDTDLTINMEDMTDLWGNTVSDQTDIGISQYQISENKGIVNGYVKDQYGYKITDAQVEIQDKAVRTDENGFYSFGEIPAGSYEAVVTKELYADGQQNIQVEDGKATRIDLTLGESQSTVGAVAGTVKNAKGVIEGAKITITLGDNQYETMTDENGAYMVTDIPVAQGYTVMAEKDGYITAIQNDIAVRPAGNVIVDLILMKDNSNTDYKINVDFDDFEAGVFEGNDDWGVINPGQDAGVVQIVEEDGNQYLYMNKTKSGTIGFYNKEEVMLEGTITIEARVKRTNNGGNANQFGMYSFNSADWKENNPSGSANPMATFALSKGNIITHNKRGTSSTVTAQKYNTDQWYTIRNVANLDTGTFDLYVDDMSAPVLKNQTLRTVNSEINKFLFFENGSNTGDLCIDYFRVCMGTPFDYNDADLWGIQVDGTELVKTEETVYEGNAEALQQSVKIIPQASSGFAKVTVNGIEFNGTDAVEVQLNDGENIIPVIVTAEDGTVKEYTLKIKKESAETLAYLTSLKVTETEITPEFASDVLEYTADVKADQETIHLQLIPVEGAGINKITVNGVEQGIRRK